MANIKISNWKQYQHYKDRRPTWIKLLIEIIEEFDADGEPKKFYPMPDSAKLTFVLLACLRANYNGKIPYPNDKWLRRRLGIKRLNLQPLVNAGFIIIDTENVSEPYQGDTESAHQSKSKRESKRTETEKEKYLDFVFLTKTEHKKVVQRYGDVNTRKLIDSLNRYIGQSGKKYKSHYYTLLNFARRDGLPEIPLPENEKEKAKREAAGIKKKQKEIRDSEGGYFRERTTKELKAILADPKDQRRITRAWLIKEILSERQKGA